MSNTAEQTFKNVLVIESVENNNTEWGLSFTDHNPEQKDYFKMPDKETAFELKKYLDEAGQLSVGSGMNNVLKIISEKIKDKGFGTDINKQADLYLFCMDLIKQYESSQPSTISEREKELTEALEKIKRLQEEWTGTPISPIEMCTKVYSIATAALSINTTKEDQTKNH